MKKLLLFICLLFTFIGNAKNTINISQNIKMEIIDRNIILSMTDPIYYDRLSIINLGEIEKAVVILNQMQGDLYKAKDYEFVQYLYTDGILKGFISIDDFGQKCLLLNIKEYQYKLYNSDIKKIQKHIKKYLLKNENSSNI